MVITASHNKSVAENATSDLATSYAMKAGYYQSRLYLEADAERAADVDSTNERWSQPIEFAIGGTRTTVKIADAASKINLAAMVNDRGEPVDRIYQQVQRLAVSLGHPEDVAARILDYQDADTRGDFEAGARNEPMTTLDELQRIDGIAREVLYGEGEKKGILRFVTVWPRAAASGTPPPEGQPAPPAQPGAGTTGQINVNTAPAEVLLALDDDMTPAIAAAIVAHRGERAQDGSYQHFKTVQDVSAVQGMTAELLQKISPACVVKAAAFEIHVTAVSGAVEKGWLYVVTRAAGQQGQPAQITLVAQQRETEARSVKPPEAEK